jgi:hypothetical protein
VMSWVKRLLLKTHQPAMTETLIQNVNDSEREFEKIDMSLRNVREGCGHYEDGPKYLQRARACGRHLTSIHLTPVRD